MLKKKSDGMWAFHSAQLQLVILSDCENDERMKVEREGKVGVGSGYLGNINDDDRIDDGDGHISKNS